MESRTHPPSFSPVKCESEASYLCYKVPVGPVCNNVATLATGACSGRGSGDCKIMCN